MLSAPLPLINPADVEAAAREAIGDEAVDMALSEGRRVTVDRLRGDPAIAAVALNEIPGNNGGEDGSY